MLAALMGTATRNSSTLQTFSNLALGRLAPSLISALAMLLIAPSSSKAEDDPGNSPPALRLVELEASDGGVRLSWVSLGEGYLYTVESTDSLTESWTVPPPASAWPIRSAQWQDQRPAASARFYRVTAKAENFERGKLISAHEVRSLSVAELNAMFAAEFVPLAAEHPVKVYRVIYVTVDPFGAQTLASGAIVAPQDIGKALPLTSYQHGTIVEKSGVPSEMTGEIIIGLALGSSGYLSALPDYLGLGQSPGLHPYLHARSEATATIDLLRATRAFCHDKSIPLNGQLFLVGYSQGGHATLAAHREIEAHHADEFTVTASAPGAGPYDLSGVTTADFLSGRPMPNPYYFLYLLAAYQSVYNFAESLGHVLAEPYDQLLPPLLDGKHSSSEINRAIGASSLLGLLRPEFLESFQNDPQHPLRLALRENDLLDWAPRAPVRLYHCRGDQDVAVANSQAAYQSLVSNGAVAIELVDPFPLANHGICAAFSLLMAKQWFDELRD
jgi:hypothetical protein